MAIHSSILAWRIPMDGGAWWAIVHGITKRDTHRDKANLKQGDYVKDCNCTFRFLAPYLALFPKYYLASYHPYSPTRPRPHPIGAGI